MDLIRKYLRKWADNTWIKGKPGINQTVLIKHELGAGENYDVACYLGKDNRGNDKYMLGNGIEIFKHHVIRWREIR